VNSKGFLCNISLFGTAQTKGIFSRTTV